MLRNDTTHGPRKEAPARAPRPSLAGNVLLLAGTLATFFLLLELALRFVAPLTKTVWGPEQARGHFGEYDSLLGWKNTPGADGSLETSEFRTTVSINSEGNRDPEMPLERTPGRFRVAFLGDSFTWGYGVDDTATYVARFRRLRPDLEAVNLGMVGYGTDQALLLWEDRGAAWRPDLVVIQFTQNDVGNNALPADRDFPKPRFLLEADTLRLTNVPVPRKEEWLTNYTIEPEKAPPASPRDLQSTIAWAKNRLRHLRAYSFLQGRYADLLVRFEKRRPGLFADVYPPSVEHDWKLTLALYDRLVASARATGARVAVVAVPIRLQIRYASWTRPHEILGRYCAERGIAFCDLLPELRREPHGERLYFPKDGHWNAGGHEVAARRIAAFLEREGLVPADVAAVGSEPEGPR